MKYQRRRPVDRTKREYFVYFLTDGAKELLYIGRSSNVARRIKAHITDASSPDTLEASRKAMWLADVRAVHLAGPFTWNEAVYIEGRLIQKEQPFGNIAGTVRAYRTHCPARYWDVA